MKSTNNQSIAEIAAVNSLQEVSMEELDQIIGAGNGVVLTLTHECNLATWTKKLKCCQLFNKKILLKHSSIFICYILSCVN